jgi:hypothetical protein
MNYCFTLANEFDERSRLYDLRDCVWGDENEKKPSDCPSKSLNICWSLDLLRPKEEEFHFDFQNISIDRI